MTLAAGPTGRILALLFAAAFLLVSAPFAVCVCADEAAQDCAAECDDACGDDDGPRGCEGDCASHCAHLCCGHAPVAPPALAPALQAEERAGWSAATLLDRPLAPFVLVPLQPPRA
jgi:hypothetical protein